MQGLKCLVKVLSLAALSAVATPFVLNAQSDPGVRAGAAGAGGPFQASRKVRRTSSIFQRNPISTRWKTCPTTAWDRALTSIRVRDRMLIRPPVDRVPPSTVHQAPTMAPPPANKIPSFLSLTGLVREVRFVKGPTARRMAACTTCS